MSTCGNQSCFYFLNNFRYYYFWVKSPSRYQTKHCGQVAECNNLVSDIAIFSSLIDACCLTKSILLSIGASVPGKFVD